MQTHDEIEDWYKKADPWGYETHPDDALRKEKIIKALGGKRFKRALDIGAGEGFITRDLPAEEIHAIEWSDTARSRIDVPVLAVDQAVGEYDLVLATGVLYGHYDHEAVMETIRAHAHGTLIIAGIKDWLIGLDRLSTSFRLERSEEYPYREIYKQIILKYERTSN